MEIHSAKFISSFVELSKLPRPDRPEYAFIGRSNVGKSSLINMLTGHSKLAKTSQSPGKTQTINHFLINDHWYLVDLPGYGYAKVSKENREKFKKFTLDYISKRENLICLFILIDARLEPQKIDQEFQEWCGENGIPFALVFTKADKMGKTLLEKNITRYKKEMLKTWEELPPSFITSAETGAGKEELLGYINSLHHYFKN